MHRIIAIALLVVFGLPFASALFAATPQSEASLPACCRRHGQHHCTMTVAERAKRMTDRHQFATPPDKCPYAPSAPLGIVHRSALALPTGQMVYAELVSHPAGTAQTESKLRIARDRTRSKRGPPASILL